LSIQLCPSDFEWTFPRREQMAAKKKAVKKVAKKAAKKTAKKTAKK
jgi:hypothetical protein